MNFLKSLFCNHVHHDLVFIRNLHGDEINRCNARSIWICKNCDRTIYRNIVFDEGNISDGYHTFNELYHHRAILTSVICKKFKNLCWKSKKHHDGTMYDGMFIVGINTPKGQATYHYNISPYWEMFDVPELDFAPEWDGHDSDQVIERIASLLTIEDKPKIVYKKVFIKEPKHSLFAFSKNNNKK